MSVSDGMIKKIKDKIKPQYLSAFFAALLAGLICHMPAMVHDLPTYDTFWNIYSDQDMISSGRQFLTFACGGSSFYNLPWINGLLALFYLGLTAALITELFDITDCFTAALAGAILAVFPAVTGTFTFIYTIDGYMLALFLATLAVVLTLKTKWGLAAGIFLLGFSLGVYQSYFSVAILLCLFVLILRILKDEGRVGGMLSLGWRFAVMGIGAYVFYVLTLKIMLSASGRSLSGYQGTDKVGGFSLTELPAGLKAAFLDFYYFTRPSGIFGENPWMKGAFLFFVILSMGFFLYAFVKKKVFKHLSGILFTVLCLAMLPFGASLISVMAPDAVFHVLMRMPWVVFFLFGLSLTGFLPKPQEKGRRFGGVLRIFSFASLTILIFNFILSANIVYFNLNERYEKTYAMCIRIADRLEQTDGYQRKDPVAILGGFPNAENYPPTEVTGKVTEGFHGTAGDYTVESSEKYAEFMKHYLNVSITVPAFEDQLELTQTREFLKMPCFPKEGSIRKIHGVWVIKLNG